MFTQSTKPKSLIPSTSQYSKARPPRAQRYSSTSNTSPVKSQNKSSKVSQESSMIRVTEIIKVSKFKNRITKTQIIPSQQFLSALMISPIAKANTVFVNYEDQSLIN